MRVDEGLQLLDEQAAVELGLAAHLYPRVSARRVLVDAFVAGVVDADDDYGLYRLRLDERLRDRKSTRLNSSHANISYAVFCLKKKKIAILTCIASVFH